MRTKYLAWGLAVCGTVAGCSDASNDGGSTEGASSSVQKYWADFKKLDLSDLTRVAAGFATDKLNGSLKVGDFAAGIDPPAVYGANQEQNSILAALPQPYNEVKSLGSIASGLAAQYGEHELSTKVTKLRLDAVSQQGGPKYFIESGFKLKGGIDHGWGFAAGWIDGSSIYFGFDANAEISSKVIVQADDQSLQSIVSAPLQAVSDMRGFIYPRSIDEIRSMKPGEMFLLTGTGKLGANVGVGVPLLSAAPGHGIAYNIVFSAGVATSIDGLLDVELVRLGGDEVVVDVGLQAARNMSFNVGVHDGFGIKGICPDGIKCLRDINAGPVHLNLEQMVTKSVTNRINQYIGSHVSLDVNNAHSRVSVSRLHFHLAQGDPNEVSTALEQALKADVRLAQAMYARDMDSPNPGVVVDFDLLRTATTTTRNFGAQLLGIKVYQDVVVDKNGTFQVDTPDGEQEVLFDELDKHGGWFQRDHGFSRIGVAALANDPKNPDVVTSQANLLLQVIMGDKHLDDDFIEDNTDGVLGALAGAAPVDALDKPANDLEREVWQKCPAQLIGAAWDTHCVDQLLAQDDMQAKRINGEEVIEFAIQQVPGDDYYKLLKQMGDSRLSLQESGINNMDIFAGPPASFTVDMHFDDKALGIMTSHKADDFRAALVSYLASAYGDRKHIGVDLTKDQVRQDVSSKFKSQIDNMVQIFTNHAQAYQNVAAADAMIAQALGANRYIPHPIGIRMTDNGDFVAQAISNERALEAAALYDDLENAAGSINNTVELRSTQRQAPMYAEQIAAFPLLALVPAANAEVSIDMKLDIKDQNFLEKGYNTRFKLAGADPVKMTATGSEVSLISGGMFNIQAIVNAAQ